MYLNNKIVSIFLSILLLVLCLKVVMKVDAMPISGDGYDNIQLSYQLAFKNVMSMGQVDENNHLVASNLREPLPIFLSALWIKTIPSLANANTFEEVISGKRLILLKMQNVLVIALLLIGTFLLSLEIAKFHLNLNHYLSLLFAASTTLLSFFCLHIVFVTTLLTEFHAAFLIVWFGWAWLIAWRTEKISWYIFSGFLLGCLILTKAAFLYIVIISFLFIFVYSFFWIKPKKNAFKQLLILIIAIVSILPWYVRNYVQIGVWELAQRGPVVLMTRAYKSNLTDDEFKGAFYAYAPLSLKKFMKKITGFSAADRITGGRLQRLTRFPKGDMQKRDLGDEEGAISYYIKATTHFNNIHKKYSAQIKDPIQARKAADSAAQKEAVAMIKNNLIGHLKSTLVFAWRGSWPCNTVDGRWSESAKLMRQPIWQEIVPFLGLLCMFGLFINALIKRKMQLVTLTLFGVSTFTFYSLATHFIPRYSEMFIPIWVICFSVLLALLIKRVLKSLCFS